MPIEKHSITASWWEYKKTDVDVMVACKGRSVLFIWLFVWLFFFLPPLSLPPPLPRIKELANKKQQQQKSTKICIIAFHWDAVHVWAARHLGI